MSFLMSSHYNSSVLSEEHITVPVVMYFSLSTILQVLNKLILTNFIDLLWYLSALVCFSLIPELNLPLNCCLIPCELVGTALDPVSSWLSSFPSASPKYKPFLNS